LARCYTPAEVIGWVNPAFRPVLEGHPAFAGFIDLSEKESLWSGAQRLRREGFKIAVFPWSTSRQAWMAALAGIPVRAGQGGRLTYSFLYTHPVAVRSLAGDVTSHWSDIQLDYARVLGCAADAADAARLMVPLVLAIGLGGTLTVCYAGLVLGSWAALLRGLGGF